MFNTLIRNYSNVIQQKHKCFRTSPSIRTYLRSNNNCTEKEYPYAIYKTTRDDFKEILDLKWEAYHPMEPVQASIGLGKIRNSVEDALSEKSLSQGYSLIARCKYDGCLSGVAINEICCPWDPQLSEKLACTIECQKLRRLYMFWAYVQKSPRMWERYKKNQIFEINNVFVREADKQKGLAKKLIEESEKLAFDAGFKVVRVDASSEWTAMICERLKMTKIYEIPYCSYIDENNTPIFQPTPPHKSLKVYVHTSPDTPIRGYSQ